MVDFNVDDLWEDDGMPELVDNSNPWTPEVQQHFKQEPNMEQVQAALAVGGLTMSRAEPCARIQCSAVRRRSGGSWIWDCGYLWSSSYTGIGSTR